METGVGDEMRMGVTLAKEIGANVSYIDRNIPDHLQENLVPTILLGEAKADCAGDWLTLRE